MNKRKKPMRLPVTNVGADKCEQIKVHRQTQILDAQDSGHMHIPNGEKTKPQARCLCFLRTSALPSPSELWLLNKPSYTTTTTSMSGIS